MAALSNPTDYAKRASALRVVLGLRRRGVVGDCPRAIERAFWLLVSTCNQSGLRAWADRMEARR